MRTIEYQSKQSLKLFITVKNSIKFKLLKKVKIFNKKGVISTKFLKKHTINFVIFE